MKIVLTSDEIKNILTTYITENFYMGNQKPVSVSLVYPLAIESHEFSLSFKETEPVKATYTVKDYIYDEVTQAIKSGNKINAIRFVRQMSNCSLQNAKLFVDSVEEKLPVYSYLQMNSFDLDKPFKRG